MTDRSCEQLRDMLVDYADGELPEQDAQAVAEHLAACRQCRQMVKGLERSLDLAQVIWLDNLEAGGTEVARRAVMQRLWWPAVAAAILVATGGTLFFSTRHRPPSSMVQYAQIEQQATRAASAARLLAATQVLAKCQGTESLVQQQARYILNHYGDTAAASELKATMPSILKGATYD